jgi:hypothetical protein
VKQKELEAMTPWEQYLAKKKEKRKAKKSKSKGGAKTEDPAKPFSDDELPDGIDPDDPFFKTTDEDPEAAGKGKNKRKDKKKKKQQQQVFQFFSLFPSDLTPEGSFLTYFPAYRKNLRLANLAPRLLIPLALL